MKDSRKSLSMASTRNSPSGRLALNQFSIIIILVLVFSGIITVLLVSQRIVEKNLDTLISSGPEKKDSVIGADSTRSMNYATAKTKAEIIQILSDTSGSLFWLKVIALFVTVGGAVGGYLIGQSQVTKNKLDFEHRKDVDASFHTIVQELSSSEPILRASAAVKLGALLQDFPSEWNVNEHRKRQMIQLTKQILAAALAIEVDEKVLKTISIAIVMDKSAKTADPERQLADVKGIDFSKAFAEDAYWARADFSNADFYRASLSKTSFRSSKLYGAQFREAIHNETVFKEADCKYANFKMAEIQGANFEKADIRGANFNEAMLINVNLEGARINGMVIKGAEIKPLPEDPLVDDSTEGDGSRKIPFKQWLLSNHP
jgi:hypothetical protein